MKRVSTNFHSGYFAANKQFLVQLPIRTIDFSNPAEKAQHDKLVSLVENMLELQKKHHEARMEQDKELYERQIKMVDTQIDRVVYDLYGLTEEEVKVVFLVMINKKKLDEEEKMEFIWEQCEKDPLVKKAISKAIKKQWIEEEFFQKMDLVKRLVSVERLVSVMMLTSSVSDIEAKHYFKDPEYNEIYKKVKKSFLSNTIDSKLIMLYNRNRSPVIKRINYFIRKYERKIYGKKYSEIQTLKKSDRSDKDEIIQSIKKSYFNDPLYEKIISLEYEKEQLRKFPYSTEDIKSPIPLS
jgi:hypothetical protein